MTTKIDDGLRKALAESLAAGITDEAFEPIHRKLKSAVDDLEADFLYRLKDDLALNLAAHAADMAQCAVEMILEGNEDQMRRYLSCEKRGEDGEYIGWTGRGDFKVPFIRNREDHEQHPVIHGELFEQGAVALRKKIVDAHRDLLVNERILDLEDQVKSLVAQVNKAIAEKEAMWERVRVNS